MLGTYSDFFQQEAPPETPHVRRIMKLFTTYNETIKKGCSNCLKYKRSSRRFKKTKGEHGECKKIVNIAQMAYTGVFKVDL